MMDVADELADRLRELLSISSVYEAAKTKAPIWLQSAEAAIARYNAEKLSPSKRQTPPSS